MDRNYGGVVWTNHALDRLRERGIKQGDAWATFSNPQQARYAATKGGWVYWRDWGNWRIEVVAKQNERKEWVILSVWSSPTDKRQAALWVGDRLERLLQLLLGRFRRR